MGEFDLSLIEEFRRRTSLYDRNSLQFKDKLYNAQQWQEISNKLGYDVSILKDRMLQLRNRYNLEKRRMEQLREEVPGKYHESPWPLYDSLQFLSNHIKARRRYKSILPVNNHKEEDMNDSGNDYSGMGPDDTAGMMDDDDNDKEDGSQSGIMQPYPNGLLTVKVENDASDEQGSEEEADDNDNNTYRQQMLQRQREQQLQQQQQHHLHVQQQQQLLIQRQLAAQQQLQQQQQQHNSRITKRHNNEQQQQHHEQQQQQRSHRPLPPLTSTPLITAAAKRRPHHDDTAASSSFYNNAPPKMPRLSPRENKYNSFGNFIASSLLDLPQKMALELVEKFTSDIVKALTMKVDLMEANAAAAAGGGNTNDGDDDGDNRQQQQQQHHHHHNNHLQNSDQ
ncbi:jing interacting gene regulatory 1 [Musca autumnalis]|uniref:jing interacting gene regulatory 1 n=1 Tax=Musca autumnalis TaxID=221902 RepID=UPI003CFB3D4E